MKKTLLALSLVLFSTTSFAVTFPCQDVRTGAKHTIEISDGHLWLDNKWLMIPNNDMQKTGTVSKDTYVDPDNTVGLALFVDSEDKAKFQYGIIDRSGQIASQGYCKR